MLYRVSLYNPLPLFPLNPFQTLSAHSNSSLLADVYAAAPGCAVIPTGPGLSNISPPLDGVVSRGRLRILAVLAERGEERCAEPGVSCPPAWPCRVGVENRLLSCEERSGEEVDRDKGDGAGRSPFGIGEYARVCGQYEVSMPLPAVMTARTPPDNGETYQRRRGLDVCEADLCRSGRLYARTV